MRPDQAAGLRARCALLTLLSRRAGAATRFARELALTGARPLIACLDDAPTHGGSPLFDWRRQLAQGVLSVQRAEGCDRVAVAGCAVGDPALLAAVHDHDWLVFDAGWPAKLALAYPQPVFVVEVASHADAAAAYAYVKAMPRLGAQAHLVGESAPAVQAAAERYLGLRVSADAHFSALVARMRREYKDNLHGRDRLFA